MDLGVYLASMTKPELDKLYDECGFTAEEISICEMVRNKRKYMHISSKLGFSEKTIYRRIKVIKTKIEKVRTLK